MRQVYLNKMPEAKINHYKEHKKTLKITPAAFKKEFPFLKKWILALANASVEFGICGKKFFKRKLVFLNTKARKGKLLYYEQSKWDNSCY